MVKLSCLFIDEPHISNIISQKKTWEIRRTPTKKRGLIALGAKGTSKAKGTTKLTDCFPMSVESLCKYQSKHCVSPEFIRTYAKGKEGKQKPLTSLWVYVLNDAKAIEPRRYTDTTGSWCFVEFEEEK